MLVEFIWRVVEEDVQYKKEQKEWYGPQHCQMMAQPEDFSLTVSLLRGKVNLFWIILWLDGIPDHVLYQPYF